MPPETPAEKVERVMELALEYRRADDPTLSYHALLATLRAEFEAAEELVEALECIEGDFDRFRPSGAHSMAKSALSLYRAPHPPNTNGAKP